jgi:guanylate kinase
MNTSNWKPLIFAVSAPSGAGKTTLCMRLLKEFPNLTYSVSCTTRHPRPGEVDGKDYHFITQQDFDRRVEAGEFLEHASVHGSSYGTLRSEVEGAVARGRDVLMDIDVQGATQIRRSMNAMDEDHHLRRSYFDIFIVPPSMEVLRMRLTGRGSDEDDVIRRRLAKAEDEMKHWKEYQYLIVNDDLEKAYDALRAVFVAAHHRVDAMDQSL